jgi:hypothetical protein
MASEYEKIKERKCKSTAGKKISFKTLHILSVHVNEGLPIPMEGWHRIRMSIGGLLQIDLNQEVCPRPTGVIRQPTGLIIGIVEYYEHSVMLHSIGDRLLTYLIHITDVKAK